MVEVIYLCPFDQDRVDPANPAIIVHQELFALGVESPRVAAELDLDFFVTVVDFEDSWKLGPGIVATPGIRGLRQDLEGGDRLGTLPERGADAVVSGIATANHNHIQTLGADLVHVDIIAPLLLLPSLQELHGKMDSLKATQMVNTILGFFFSVSTYFGISSRYWQISRSGCSHCHQNSIVVGVQVNGRNAIG